jgi:Tol biopolymer transport system component
MRMPRRVGRGCLLAVLMMLAGLVLAGPAHATFPGRNGRIAFADANTGQLYTINPDGTGLRQVTHVAPSAIASRPDWSPDGRRIAFASIVFSGDQAVDGRLYVIDRDGSHQHPVFADTPGYRDFLPKYAPDGDRLVFMRCQPDQGSCAIDSVRTDGTRLRGLTPFTQGAQLVVDYGPAVSPDGRRVAFNRFSAGGTQSQVYVMRADGSGAHPITPLSLGAFIPDWTPDGRHLLVTSNCCQGSSAIYQVKPDGSDLQRLTNPPSSHNDFDPSAAPQGNQIAFSSDRAYPDLCCVDLFIMRADGSGLHKVPTGGLSAAFDPDWGPAASDDGSTASTASHAITS